MAFMPTLDKLKHTKATIKEPDTSAAAGNDHQKFTQKFTKRTLSIFNDDIDEDVYLYDSDHTIGIPPTPPIAPHSQCKELLSL